VVGLSAGGLSALLTVSVYAAEDLFRKLPIHWMWWPALGGLVIGAGGLFFPQALGVGYDVIGAMLKGQLSMQILVGVLIVKGIIWSMSLGSGTSGGVLAPLLMMGGALGGLEAVFLPNEGLGFWPLVSMGAILGGTMRSPFTGVIFALELTHDVNILLPLLVGAFVAHAVTVLLLKRSILTEKIARRGYHLSREYSADPLEILFVREVMRTNVTVLPAGVRLRELASALRQGQTRGQRLYPVLNDDRHLVGVATRADVRELLASEGGGRQLADVLKSEVVVAYPDEPLRAVMYRMAETNLTRFPVVERGAKRKLVGVIGLNDMLKGTQRQLDEERRRERVLRTRLPFRTRNGTGARTAQRETVSA
jgi:chloride channel protein, CIC family